MPYFERVNVESGLICGKGTNRRRLLPRPICLILPALEHNSLTAEFE